MTQTTQTAKKEIVLTEKTETSPSFVNTVDAIDFLTTIDGFIHQLNNTPTSDTADRVLKQLRKYQILSIEHAGINQWITGPMTIKKQTIKNGMSKRIGHLMQSGGEWLAETIQKDRVEVPSCTALPISIPITMETRREMKSENLLATSVTSLSLFLTSIHTKLMRAAEHGGIGVFEHPFGATNANRMVNWLESHSDHSAWAMRNTIASHTMDELADDAVFSAIDEN